jgi:hypothetical protein
VLREKVLQTVQCTCCRKESTASCTAGKGKQQAVLQGGGYSRLYCKEKCKAWTRLQYTYMFCRKEVTTGLTAGRWVQFTILQGGGYSRLYFGVEEQQAVLEGGWYC